MRNSPAFLLCFSVRRRKAIEEDGAMIQRQRLASALALCASNLGCSGTEETSRADLELLTWWSQPSERRAIEAVIAVYEAEHPRATVRVLYAGQPGRTEAGQVAFNERKGAVPAR